MRAVAPAIVEEKQMLGSATGAVRSVLRLEGLCVLAASAFAYAKFGTGACLAIAAGSGARLALGAGLIWCAHVGFDRALGYGLKYSRGFGHTHPGLIGRAAREASRDA